LVAEEYPFPGIRSTAQRIASDSSKAYIQIDPLPAEWCALGIYEEMQTRANPQCPQRKDVRLSHADSVREKFCFEQIERNIDHGRVLVVCGYLHQAFFADRVRERGKVLEQLAYPEDLLDRKPERIFTPDELKEYLTEKER
jgi:hypothetical protein